jgi:nucleoside 2-deoxyribosyltransferase
VTVYIAAPYEMRQVAVAAMKELEGRGFEVTSTWLKQLDEEGEASARQDLADIARADILLAINPEEWRKKGGGGRHAEFGFALALGKTMVLLGVRSHIFHHLKKVRMIQNVSEL